MASSERGFMFIFPGQGAQYRGMGSDLHAEFLVARRVYDNASELLGIDLADLSFRDLRGELDRTELTQVALFTHSIACLEVFRELAGDAVRPHVTAGHSLGEYSALVAAGVLRFEDALRLVRARAAAMAEHGRGTMVALRLGASIVRTFVDRFYCGIGGCNLPDQTVVGGAADDLKELVDFVRTRYGVRAIQLNTRGAFHTYLMSQAAEAFRPALSLVPFSAPRCRVMSNYTGTYHSFAPETIKAHLFFQIFHPVRWMWQLQRALADGVDVVIEFGGGTGAASSPASKIPNLQGITRAAIARTNHAAVYCAGISADHLKETARFVHAYSSIVEMFDDRRSADTGAQGTNGAAANGQAEQSFRLYVPTVHRMPIRIGVEMIRSVAELGLTNIVEIVAEPVERNVETLRWLDAQRGESPQPYLEVVYACEAAAVLHYVGAEILPQLTALARRPPQAHVSAVA